MQKSCRGVIFCYDYFISAFIFNTHRVFSNNLSIQNITFHGSQWFLPVFLFFPSLIVPVLSPPCLCILICSCVLVGLATPSCSCVTCCWYTCSSFPHQLLQNINPSFCCNLCQLVLLPTEEVRFSQASWFA